MLSVWTWGYQETRKYIKNDINSKKSSSSLSIGVVHFNQVGYNVTVFLLKVFFGFLFLSQLIVRY